MHALDEYGSRSAAPILAIQPKHYLLALRVGSTKLLPLLLLLGYSRGVAAPVVADGDRELHTSKIKVAT